MSVHWRVACILILLLATSGCTTFTAKLKPSQPHLIGSPKLPIDVGIYFSPEVRAYVVRYSWSDVFGGKEVYLFPMGDETVALFHGVMQQTFRSSPLVSELPPFSQENVVKNVLQIDVDRVDIFFGRPVPKPSNVELIYKVKAYDKHKGVVAEWTVMGVAEMKGAPAFSRPPPHLIKTVEMAMVDAAKKFASSFKELPEARQWLESVQNP